MSRRLVFFTVIAYVFHSLVAFPPLTILPFVAAIVLPGEFALVVSFFLGFLADLLYGSLIGPSIVVYLAISAFTLLYKRKISSTNLGFLVFMSMLCAFLERFILLRSWNLGVVILTPFTVLLLSFGRWREVLNKS